MIVLKLRNYKPHDIDTLLTCLRPACLKAYETRDRSNKAFNDLLSAYHYLSDYQQTMLTDPDTDPIYELDPDTDV